jgi:hypothetical protein
MRWNDLLDELPGVRFGRGATPVFKSLGFAGYYAALIATLGGGLLAQRSLPALALVALTCAGSFYAWAHLRRRFVGREQLVLFEHVWFALAASAGVLRLLDQPVLAHLDVVAVALCFFLAFGRVGCLLVGCCHGRPAPLGVCYGEQQVRDGLPAHLEGVRLFPVAAVEALGLVAIGVVGLVALAIADAGAVLAWFLGGYAVLRFATEGLRGDRRPHLAGLSIGRWMALAQLAGALVLGWPASAATLHERAAAIAVAAITAVAIAWRFARQPSRRLLSRRHVAALRARILATQADAPTAPALALTSRGVRVVVSAAAAQPGQWYVSLRLPRGLVDLELLCALAARAVPELRVATAELMPGEILLLRLATLAGTATSHGGALEHALFFELARRGQARARAAAARDEAPARAPADPPPPLLSPVAFVSLRILPGESAHDPAAQNHRAVMAADEPS